MDVLTLLRLIVAVLEILHETGVIKGPKDEQEVANALIARFMLEHGRRQVTQARPTA